jgi:putative membrane protein
MPPEPESPAAFKGLSLTDQGFAKAAAQAIHEQVQLGLLAEDRGATQAVRERGRQLARDHHRLGFELDRLAEGEGLPLPAATPPSDQPNYQRLEALSGEDFDRAFLDQERAGLAEEAELFRTEAVSGTHSSLRAFASKHAGDLRLRMDLVKTDRIPL